MIEILRKLRDLLDRRERRNAVLLLGLMLVMGLVEALGVASIMPFVAVLSNPQLIESNSYLSAVYKGLGFADRSAFLIFLATLAFIVVVGRIALTALTTFATARYSEMRSFSLSTRLLESYLRRPYSWFLNHHSADMGKGILWEVEAVVKGGLVSALNLISQSAIAVFLIALVLVVQPLVALSATVVLGGAYSLIYINLRRYLSKIGRARFRANHRRYLTVQEALAGIKELKVGGLERAYLRRFSEAAYRFSSLKATSAVVGAMPRYFLEALTIGGLLTVILVLLTTQGGELSRIFPVLALYAFAGLRLLPALQSVYANLASLSLSGAALHALHADLGNAQNAKPPVAALAVTRNKPLPLRQSLELRNVTFAYPNAERPTLSNVSLTIPARATIGFVGSTGAGKTTVVDVIVGLLEPQEGEVVVDGVRITSENYHCWRQTIGYVPQHIFLADETVAANIALGAPPDKIDLQAVEKAARVAELHDFVIGELPQDYQTKVGEKGVRLSGGQRQRIGIARALYHDPDVLVLDEATSALDSVTERAVMDAVHNLAHKKTILIIAHRLTTVRACDRLFLLEKGRLKAHGTYDDLLNADREFRQMAS
jgi:ATP-binding cassette, subfamily B, bacterial PglK